MTRLAAAYLLLGFCGLSGLPAWTAGEARLLDRIAAIEQRSGGRLGVAALETATGRKILYRSGERFPMCSSFKLLLAGAVLARVDGKKESLSRRVPYAKADLLPHAPVTSIHLSEGSMTVSDLCAAAIETSDNTAANLLLRIVGGPPGLTAYARSLGDTVTRLDRDEPELNSAIPGDERDTTSPGAMLRSMARMFSNEGLSPEARRLLEKWLIASTTGKSRVRAGIPPGWRAGDKTGTCEFGSTNDLALLWPPGKEPIIAVVCLTGSTKSIEEREAVLAEVGKFLASKFGR